MGKTGKTIGAGQPQRPILSLALFLAPFLARHPQISAAALTDNPVMAVPRRDRSVARSPDIMRRPPIITRALLLNGEHMAAVVTAHRHVVIAPQTVRHGEGVLAMRTFQMHL